MTETSTPTPHKFVSRNAPGSKTCAVCSRGGTDPIHKASKAPKPTPAPWTPPVR